MMRTHNTFLVLVSFCIGTMTASMAIGKEKPKRSDLPAPKDYSDVVPNLVGGIDREIDLDKGDRIQSKIQNQPKSPELPPLELSKKPSQFQSGAIYSPGEEMVFTGEPSYFVNNEPINEDKEQEVQEATPQAPELNMKGNSKNGGAHEDR